MAVVTAHILPYTAAPGTPDNPEATLTSGPPGRSALRPTSRAGGAAENGRMIPRGVVVSHVPDPNDHACEHERVTLRGFARRLAALQGFEDGGVYEPGKHYPAPLYFVPSSTLTGEEAAALGIHGPDDLFGGVVPQRFVASKAITHPLVAAGAAAPPGWNAQLAPRLGEAVLAGYAAFTAEDARQAGLQLLAHGRARIKPVRASGGRGQSVAHDAAELQSLLDAMDPDELVTHGVVLEEDLAEVSTFSVGQVRVAGLVASYHGFQRLTRSNDGEEVYGGSELTVVRGDFDALLASGLTAEVRRAVEQAQRYDAAVRSCFTGFFASRSNYDIVLGRDARGRWKSGVLEQSWRVGGATGPELAALEIFRADPQRTRVRAGGFEFFGHSPEPPPDAAVHFRGADPQVGLLTKYTVVEPDVDAR